MENHLKETCPASALLKSLSGKWKPEIFRLALKSSLRFSLLIKELPNSNKQSITTALRDLVNDGLLERFIIKEKPINIEYRLTDKGKSLVAVFEQLEQLI